MNEMWNTGIRYENLELLGEGGQGRVFKALRVDRATGLSATVALKILHSETAVELWKREFESLRRVRSPYCVQVISFDRVRRRPALVLEYVEGISLSHLGRATLLGMKDVQEISAQIEAALRDLQDSGIVHGDLSPSNVLLGHDGQIKLLDFGLANHGGPQARLTPEFASPARLTGEPPTIQDDLFSLRKIESFLLGRPVDKPAAFQSGGSSATGRRRLARKVSLFLERRQWSSRFKTRTQQIRLAPIATSRRLVAAAIALSFAISASSAAPRPTNAQPQAKLSIRTLQWHELAVDGHNVGYAPADIIVSAERAVQLSWKNARGTGHRQLQLTPGQHLLLEDQDLAGRSHAGTGGTASHIRNAGGRADEGPPHRVRGRRVHVSSGN